MTEKIRQKLEYRLNCLLAVSAYNDYEAMQRKNKRRISSYTLRKDTVEIKNIHKLTLKSAENITPDEEREIKAFLAYKWKFNKHYHIEDAESVFKRICPTQYAGYKEKYPEWNLD